MKALVTGGAGFIGSHLVQALSSRGDEVVVMDDDPAGPRSRVGGFPDGVRVLRGDIRDPRSLDDAAAGCEVILHEAAIASVPRSFQEPRLTNEVNTSGTIEVMLAAERAGVRRVVFAGSSSVYGLAPSVPLLETAAIDPRSPYAASKVAAEHYLRTLGPSLGVETVVLRYFNVFGPSQDPASEYAAVVPRFITAALAGERPVVYGDGNQSRDFVYVDNVVSANMLAASVPGVDGLTANIGCGVSYSLHDLLELIAACLDRSMDVIHEPSRAGDVPFSEADISSAQDRLGYAVLVPFEEGVRRTVEWYRAKYDREHHAS